MLIDVAASGIRAADVWLAVSANNIANVNTDNFRASRTTLREQPSGQGVRAFIERTDHPTDLATESVEQILALRYGQANGKVFKMHSESLGDLINMWA